MPVETVNGRIVVRPSRRPRRNIEAIRAAAAQRRAGGTARPEEGRSVFGQLGDIALKLPGGLLHMGGELAQGAVAPIRIASDIATGREVGDLGEFIQRYQPFAGETIASGGRTGGRLVNTAASLAPGGAEPFQQYRQASRESGIVGALIEDVGNVAAAGAIATGGTSLAAGRAAAAGSRLAAPLARTAATLERGTRLANVVADAPARTFTVPARLAFRGARRGLERVAPEMAERAATRAAGYAERAGLSRLTREAIMEGRGVAAQESKGIRLGTQRALKTGITPDEQQAVLLLKSSQAPVLRALGEVRARGDEAAFRALRAKSFSLETGPTDAALHTALDYLDERLDPKIRARMDEAWGGLKDVIGEQTERRLGGEGRVRIIRRPGLPPEVLPDPLSPAQLVDEPIPELVAAELAPQQARIAAQEKMIQGTPQRPGLAGQLAEAQARVPQVAPPLPAERALAAGGRLGRVEGAAAESGRVAGRLERRAGEVRRPYAAQVLGTEGRTAAQRRIVLEERVPAYAERAKAGVGREMGQIQRYGERRGARRRDVAILEGKHKKAVERLGSMQEKLTGMEEAFARGPLKVAPGRFHPALMASRRALDALYELADAADTPAELAFYQDLADSLPQDMVALLEQADSPFYLPGALDEPTKGTRLQPGRAESLPKLGETPSQKQKRAGLVPGRFDTVAREFTRDVYQRQQNVAAQILTDMTDPKTGAKLARTGQEILADLADQGKIDAELAGILGGRRTGNPGPDLAKEMERHGYSAWDPASADGTLPATAVRPETQFIPTEVLTRFRRWFKEPLQQVSVGGHVIDLTKVVDQPTRIWKHMVLAFSPAWHVMNILGNTFLATVGAGIDPVTLVRSVADAYTMLKAEGGNVRAARKLGVAPGTPLLPARIHGTAQFAETMRHFQDQDPRNFLTKFVNLSYRANEFVDDLGRSAVYLAKRKKGWSEAEAVKISLRAMGDFGRLSPIERDVIRRFAPFYSWQRHVTQLAWHLSIDHPYRLAWTLNLGQTFAPEGMEDLPGFLKGSLQIPENVPLVGGRYIPLTAMNPLQGVAGSPLTPPSQWPREARRSLNPFLRLGAAATNISLGEGRALSRPLGTGPVDEYGRPTGGLISPKELAYVAAQQVPQGRLLTSALGEPVVRYEQGSPMVVGGRPLPREGGRAPEILRNLGIPFVPMAVDAEDIRNRTRRRLAERAEQRRRYEGALG